jgi:hypothetical protein
MRDTIDRYFAAFNQGDAEGMLAEGAIGAPGWVVAVVSLEVSVRSAPRAGC